MAEPVALNINVPQFDPLKYARQGVELGLLGAKPYEIAQELQKGAQAIRETDRAYAMQTRKDDQRKRLSEIVKGFVTKDKNGKETFDHEGAVRAAQAEGIDPDTLSSVESNWLSNASTSLKTNAERQDFLNKWRTNTYNNARRMNPQEALAYVKRRVDESAKSFGVEPAEEYKNVMADLGVDETSPFDPSSLPDRLNRAATVRSIDVKGERGLMSAGTSTEQLDPKSTLNAAGIKLLRDAGFNIPEGATVGQLMTIPGVEAALIKLPLEERASYIVPTGERAAGHAAEVGAKVERVPYDNAISLADKYKTEILGKPEAVIKDFLARLTSNEDRARIQGAIDDYNTRNPAAKISMSDGVGPVFARLRQQQAKFETAQQAGREIQSRGKFNDGGAQAAADAARADTGSQLRAREQELAEIDASIKKVERTMSTSTGKAYETARDTLRDLQSVRAATERDIKRMGLDKGKKEETKKLVGVRNKETGKSYDMPADVAERAIASGRYVRE